MRRAHLLYIGLFIFLVQWGISCDEEKEGIAPSPNTVTPDIVTSDTISIIDTVMPKASWTFMLYDAADFKGYDPLIDFAKEVHSSDQVYYVVLRDGFEEVEGGLYYVDGINQPRLLQKKGEINMGSETVLADFIAYSKKKFPAERYALLFYDHGGGWRGACWDKTNGSDNLSMDEIQGAISNTGGVDFVINTAPCLMGAVESVYELRNDVDVYIGSENTSGYCWWFSTLEQINNLLIDQPDIDNYSLADFIIRKIDDNHIQWRQSSYVDAEEYTMVAVDPGKTLSLVQAIDSLALMYLSQPDSLKKMLNAADSNMTFFSTGYVDIGSFIYQLLSLEDDPEICVKLNNVIQKLNECVISECHGTNFQVAEGLNIFFPGRLRENEANVLLDLYQNCGLDFARATHWGLLMNKMYGTGTVSTKSSSYTNTSTGIPYELNHFYPIKH